MACAASPKAARVEEVANGCTRVGMETSAAASGLARRNRREATRNKDSRKEEGAAHPQLADHRHLFTLSHPPRPQEHRSRRGGVRPVQAEALKRTGRTLSR